MRFLKEEFDNNYNYNREIIKRFFTLMKDKKSITEHMTEDELEVIRKYFEIKLNKWDKRNEQNN